MDAASGGLGKLAFTVREPLGVIGGVMINKVPTLRVDQMPYGGVKESGMGREGLNNYYKLPNKAILRQTS